MRFKTTLILFGVFLLLLTGVYFFELRDQGEENLPDKLISLDSDDVIKIVFDNGEETIQIQKENDEWMITAPIEAKGDNYEVDRLADDFSDVRIERVVEQNPSDLEKYGIPLKEIDLYTDSQDQPVKILIGMENPLDNTFFAKRADETKVVLIPSSLKNLLEKKFFDLRQKDIFQLDSDQAKGIKLRGKDIQWEAEKVDEEWFLRQPVNALAQKSEVESVINAISNLNAETFVSEEKNDADVKNYGLDGPDYEVTIDFPVDNRRISYQVNKKDDSVYATSSASPKIIRVADSILSDLEKEPGDLREKSVAEFYTWEVRKLQIRKGEVALTLTKDEEENWQSDIPEIKEIDKEKVQSFLRKMEALEAEEFVDPPLNLADYGLIDPQAEVKIWTEDEESPDEMTLQIGEEDLEANKIYVKNARFDYIFKLDSTFLEEFPENPEDWKKVQEEEKKEEK